MRCENCEHWRRWPSHDEIACQSNWGDCGVLESSELIDAYDCTGYNDELTVHASEYNTRKDFGCVLFKEREKK